MLGGVYALLHIIRALPAGVRLTIAASGDLEVVEIWTVDTLLLVRCFPARD